MALTPFAHFQTQQGPITFLKSLDGQDIQAQVPDVEKMVPVDLPKSTAIEKSSLGSAAMKVQQLLRNVHLQPVYQSNQVNFVPFPPQGKTWEKVAQKDVSVDLWMARRDGTLVFADRNCITTWDWAQDRQEEVRFDNFTITALVENEEGSLLLGSDQGKLRFLKGEVVDTGINKPIDKIVCLKCSYYLVQFEGNDTLIVSMKLSKMWELGAHSGCVVLENERVVILVDSILTGYKFNLDTEESEKSSIPCQQADCIEQISPRQFLVFSGTNVEVWDKENLHEGPCRSYFAEDSRSWRAGPFCAFNNRVACLNPCDNKGHVVLLGDGDLRYGDRLGWGVQAMAPLSDGTVAYTTDTRDAGFYIVNSEGRIVFSRLIKKYIEEDSQVISLVELVDGSIAACTRSKIFVLTPKLDPSLQEDYQNEKKSLLIKHDIEKCELEIKYNPDNGELYKKLAMLKGGTLELQYRALLLQLQVACRTSQIYQARRLYEQARKVNPEDIEPCQLFLTFLHNSTYQSLARRVQLDLFSINKDPQVLPCLTKLKPRLFVGEGDFSYTEALLKKHEQTHPELGKAITATEYKGDHQARWKALQKKGVKIFTEVDGCKLHEAFKGQRFKRIHWNLPFGVAKDREAFRSVIPQFFKACAELQKRKDRVHVTLMQEPDGYWKFRQRENPIVLGATSEEYRLIRKRRFNPIRYPGYQHVKTDGTPCTLSDEKREFVFEKTEGISVNDPLALKDPKEKELKIGYDSNTLEDAYYECSTDDDSSDYYDSEEDSTGSGSQGNTYIQSTNA